MKKSDNIFQDIFEITKQIPPGKVTTYGAIAEYIGAKNGARLVGWAMNLSHSHTEFIPAHRVVNRKGLLTGKHHFGGEQVMQQMLEAEGIIVKNDQIINFNQHFWSPHQLQDSESV